MNSVRKAIFEVRKAWRDSEKKVELIQQIHDYFREQNDDLQELVQADIERLLSAAHDYADIQQTEPGNYRDNTIAIEIYCSENGYRAISALTSQVFRTESVQDKVLYVATALVEFLTIELYNIRLANIGIREFANFTGIVYRGMPVSQEVVNDFREIADHHELEKRNFSIPLGLISTSASQGIMQQFAANAGARHKMLWTIHIYALDTDLLKRYRQLYPESIVTSICAVPVAHIAEFSETEILLRGPFFHLIKMESEKANDCEIHRLCLMMLNANRDHGTELGDDYGEKGLQREYFKLITQASRYKFCASLAAAHGKTGDASGYRELYEAALHEIKMKDVVHSQSRKDCGSSDLQYEPYEPLLGNPAPPILTWLGSSVANVFPRYYALRRSQFQRAAQQGHWGEVLHTAI